MNLSSHWRIGAGWVAAYASVGVGWSRVRMVRGDRFFVFFVCAQRVYAHSQILTGSANKRACSLSTARQRPSHCFLRPSSLTLIEIERPSAPTRHWRKRCLISALWSSWTSSHVQLLENGTLTPWHLLPPTRKPAPEFTQFSCLATGRLRPPSPPSHTSTLARVISVSSLGSHQARKPTFRCGTDDRWMAGPCADGLLLLSGSASFGADRDAERAAPLRAASPERLRCWRLSLAMPRCWQRRTSLTSSRGQPSPRPGGPRCAGRRLEIDGPEVFRFGSSCDDGLASVRIWHDVVVAAVAAHSVQRVRARSSSRRRHVQHQRVDAPRSPRRC